MTRHAPNGGNTFHTYLSNSGERGGGLRCGAPASTVLVKLYSRPPEILNPEIVNLQKIVNKSLGPDDSIKKTPKIVNKKDSKRPWADSLN
jgi:hypothetical protein